MQYTPSVIPESYLQLTRRSLKFYVAAFPHVIIMAFIAAFIAFIPRFIDVIWNYQLISHDQVLGYQAFWILFFNLLFLILFTSILWRIQCRITGSKDTIANDIITACKKLPRIFVASLIQMFCFNLTNIITITLFLLFLANGEFRELTALWRFTIIASIILQVCAAFAVFFIFYFYLPLILTESKGILVALKKSVRLVWGNLWRTISFQITPWIVYLLAVMLIRRLSGLDLHLYFIESQNITVYSAALHLALFALLIPWLAVNFLVQLRDLELRKGLSAL